MWVKIWMRTLLGRREASESGKAGGACCPVELRLERAILMAISSINSWVNLGWFGLAEKDEP